jgi:hypothetical protein
MDFDRCTGLLSNAIVIDNNLGTPRYTGSCFSPNGNLIYICKGDTTSYLYQYDLTSSNIPASRIILDSISYPLVAGGALRLAPDDKIYWTCAWTNQVVFSYPYQDTMYHTENMNLSVINDPDIVGTGCNFSLYSFNLGGKRTYWGLPNNPDYTLGRVAGSICDSLSIGIPAVNQDKFQLNVFYHPGFEVAYINAQYVFGKSYSLVVSDMTGKEIYMESEKLNNSYVTKSIDCQNFENGIYLVNLIIDNDIVRSKKFSIIH